ncbi:MAG: hypothetical protein IKY83_14430 [Proteobacteria bacterium]|nr:hypothetical protein [Pseudomonadota bacterium]
MKYLRISATLFTAIGMLFVLAGCPAETTPKNTTMNYWDKKKGDCDEVLKMPHAYGLSQITYCTKVWETYRYVDDIPLKERSMYAVAFSTVSHKATDPYDRTVADAALARICIPRHPMDASGQIREEIPSDLVCDSSVGDIRISGQAVASKNPFERMKRTVEVEEVSDKAEKASNAAYNKATAQRQKKSYNKALSLYKDALESNPFNIQAKYDIASMLAIMGDENGALRHLEELNSWNHPVAEKRITDARSDADFDNIRDNPNFKLITGYVRVVVVNGASTVGLQKVKDIKTKLEKKNIPVAAVSKSDRVELQPQIWYREGFEDYAYKIKEYLNFQQKVVVSVMRENTNNDVLVVWGQPEALEFTGSTSGPVVQGERAKGSENKLDDMVKGVEDAKKSADHAKDVGSSLTSFK